MPTLGATEVARLVKGDGESSSVVADLLTSGFPSADRVAGLVGYRPEAGRWNIDHITEGPALSVTLGPGLIELSAKDLARAERAHNRAADFHAPGCHSVDAAAVRRRPARGRRITSWSRRSRARMVRKMVATDWRPMLRLGVPVMVTVTYPGPWRLWAPTADVVRSHRRAFLERYARRFGHRALGVWKLEFQRRGAPHIHMLLPLPNGVGLQEFRTWVADAWSGSQDFAGVIENRRADVIRVAGMLQGGPEFGELFYLEHRDRSRAATHARCVDIAEGLRCRDPRRIAVYFLKHSMKTRDGKEYQNVVPAGWVASGRFWSVINMGDATATAYLNPRDWIVLRRTLRRWARANNRAVFRSSRLVGGWVAVNDGPSFLADLSRALALALFASEV